MHTHSPLKNYLIKVSAANNATQPLLGSAGLYDPNKKSQGFLQRLMSSFKAIQKPLRFDYDPSKDPNASWADKVMFQMHNPMAPMRNIQNLFTKASAATEAPLPANLEYVADSKPFFGRNGTFDPKGILRLGEAPSAVKNLMQSRSDAAQSAKDLGAAQQFSEARELASSANRNAIAKEWQKYTKSKYNPMAGGADSRAMGGILGRLGTRDWTTLSQKEKYNLINPGTEKALRRM